MITFTKILNNACEILPRTSFLYDVKTIQDFQVFLPPQQVVVYNTGYKATTVSKICIGFMLSEEMCNLGIIQTTPLFILPNQEIKITLYNPSNNIVNISDVMLLGHFVILPINDAHINVQELSNDED